MIFGKNKKDGFHYKGNLTFWAYAKANYNVNRPKKYAVLFSSWYEGNMAKSFSCTEFDTLDEALEEAKLINKLYSDTPKPVKIYKEIRSKYSPKCKWNNNYIWDFSNGGYFWGYMVIDMINEKFVKIINGLRVFGYNLTSKPGLSDYDMFFRGEDEIPQDYEWDERGEYEGWLQFRWGDGKNAIDYVEPPKKERPGVDEIWEVYDEATDTYKKQKVRVVYVDWKDPLPKREKGIKYLRPNKEPVLFPGDFGYEDDLNMGEWSLAEEMAGDEYLNKMGKKNFDIEKPTTSSIAEILGDKNPLLKLLDKK